MFNVINNFIDNEHLFNIQKIITNNNFPWYINERDPFILAHKIINRMDDKVSVNSDFFSPITENIIKKLEIKKFNFCQLTLFARNKSVKKFNNNFNSEDIFLTKKVILFLNTCHGYIETLESRLEAVENRVLIFDKKTPFKLYTQTDTNYMIMLEIEYL